MFKKRPRLVVASALGACGVVACASNSPEAASHLGASASGTSSVPVAGGTGGGGRPGAGSKNLTGSLAGSGNNATASGGQFAEGGATAHSGKPATAAATASGGKSTSEAMATKGGQPAAAGANAKGGESATAGGATSSGGRSDRPGASAMAGNSTSGGVAGGVATSSGGRFSAGGSGSVAGTSVGMVAGGMTTNSGTPIAGSDSKGPCDIYAADNAPCAAAHSTVRALYVGYSGNLYQVRRASDKTTMDVPVVGPGSLAKASVQESFCSGTKCTISIIYDQSPNGNHLTKSPAGGWLNNGGLEADASAAKIKLSGHDVYGVYTTSNFDNDVGAVGYRNNKTKGVATGDQPESMYMVVSGKHYNQWCCFDYGNAETNNLDNGDATMEAVYFGSSTQWGRGIGNGPWVMADLENGVFAGNSFAAPASNTSIVADYVTAMLKGPSGNRFMLKGGSAQSGTLETKYDGARPNGYSPMKKEGAIVLGVGGDNSHTGEGTFFEGCMTAGVPTDAADNAVQANIAAAGYGR